MTDKVHFKVIWFMESPLAVSWLLDLFWRKAWRDI
jgi:hypothetical protein